MGKISKLKVVKLIPKVKSNDFTETTFYISFYILRVFHLHNVQVLLSNYSNHCMHYTNHWSRVLLSCYSKSKLTNWLLLITLFFALKYRWLRLIFYLSYTWTVINDVNHALLVCIHGVCVDVKLYDQNYTLLHYVRTHYSVHLNYRAGWMCLYKQQC